LPGHPRPIIKRLARACFDAAPGEGNSMIETRDTWSSTAGGLVVYVPGMRARRAEKALPAERRVEAVLAGLRAEPRIAGFDYFVHPRAITRFSRGNLSARRRRTRRPARRVLVRQRSPRKGHP